ncbi:MAG: hypothetical protein WCE30_21795 [Mycobacterium sp.]
MSGGDVTKPSGTEGADLVAPHWPEWSETSYINGAKVALGRGEAAGRGAEAGTSGAVSVPDSGGSGVAADALVDQYTNLGTDLAGQQAYHTAEAQGLALNGANHYATKTILAGVAEDHDQAKEGLIAAGMMAGIPQPKMQQVLDELNNATSTAAQNVGQAHRDTHKTLTSAINSGSALSAPPKGMPGGAGLPADVPSQLAPLLQMATQGPQMASGAVGQLVSGLSGMTGAFTDPIQQLMGAVGQGAGQPTDSLSGLDSSDGHGGSGSGEHGGSHSQLASHHSSDGGDGRDGSHDRGRADSETNSERDGEPKTLGASSHEQNSVPATHLSSSGSTVQLDAPGGAALHLSSGSAVADPSVAGVQAGTVPVTGPAAGGAPQASMGAALGSGMGGSLGFAGPTPTPSQRSGPAGRHAGGPRRPGDQSPRDVTARDAAAAAAATADAGVGVATTVSAEAMFGTRILAHLVHQDPSLIAAAVAVFPMAENLYAITCTPDALGALRGGIVAPHATMPLSSLTTLPGEFRAEWSGMGDPVAPLYAAVRRSFLQAPEVIVVFRAAGTPAPVTSDVRIVPVSMEELLATDPVADSTMVTEKVVAPEHIAPIIEDMAAEWAVPSDLDLASAFAEMRARTWYQGRNPEYVYAMAWWMIIEAHTALAGGDTEHAAALAWQLLALPPAPSLVS